MNNLNWAILGTGSIANEFAAACKNNIYTVGNRTHKKAVDFASKYGIKKVYDDFNEMFTDDNVDVIYIATPHNSHFEYMIKAIENGKHILVEKSITLNSDELKCAMLLAKEKGVVIAEAMTVYHMPIYKKLKSILESGKLGQVNLVNANFGSFKEYDMNNRFFSRDLAGGAMLDIGVYALSFVRWFISLSSTEVRSVAKKANTGVDEKSGIVMMNSHGQIATVMLSLHSKQPKRATVSCEKGYIEIEEYPRGCEAKIYYVETGEAETIKCGDGSLALLYEFEDMEKAISENGDMCIDLTLDVMEIMTRLRDEWNVVYPEEEC